VTSKTPHLTPTERRLLTCLVQNPGRVVSHKELLEAMSPGNPSNNMNNVRECISRLRKKVEIDPALPRVIMTHYGLGYSFDGQEEAQGFPENIGFSGGIWHSGMNWLTILPSTRFVSR